MADQDTLDKACVWLQCSRNSARRDHGKRPEFGLHNKTRRVKMGRQGTREKTNACHCNPPRRYAACGARRHNNVLQVMRAHARCNASSSPVRVREVASTVLQRGIVPLSVIAWCLHSGTARSDWRATPEHLLDIPRNGARRAPVTTRNGRHGPTEQSSPAASTTTVGTGLDHFGSALRKPKLPQPVHPSHAHRHSQHVLSSWCAQTLHHLSPWAITWL